MTAMSLSHETMPMGWISASAVKRAFSSSGKSATSATKGKLLPAILETSRSAAYYDSNAYQDLSNPTETEIWGNYGVYLLLDQLIYREGGPEGKQGLTPFAEVTVAPSDRNTFPFFYSTGLVYQGLIPRRDRDTMAVGLAYGKFSRALKDQDFEMISEWTYEMALVPWLTLQPDMQYIFKPGGTGDIPNAFVLGIQISLSL
jgi:carbohydrate-selective porin OprB